MEEFWHKILMAIFYSTFKNSSNSELSDIVLAILFANIARSLDHCSCLFSFRITTPASFASRHYLAIVNKEYWIWRLKKILNMRENLDLVNLGPAPSPLVSTWIKQFDEHWFGWVYTSLFGFNCIDFLRWSQEFSSGFIWYCIAFRIDVSWITWRTKSYLFFGIGKMGKIFS